MKNVLIFADNKDILQVLEVNLGHFLEDCRVLTAFDAQRAVELLRSMPIDLAVTDLDMPRKKGYDFISRAREHFPAVRHCVIMTGMCDQKRMECLRSMGVARFIQKPFPYRALASMINEQLSAGPIGPVGCKDKPC